MKLRIKAQIDEISIIDSIRSNLRIIAAGYKNAPCVDCRKLAAGCGSLADELTRLLKARGPQRTTIDPGDLPPWDLT